MPPDETHQCAGNLSRARARKPARARAYDARDSATSNPWIAEVSRACLQQSDRSGLACRSKCTTLRARWWRMRAEESAAMPASGIAPGRPPLHCSTFPRASVRAPQAGKIRRRCTLHRFSISLRTLRMKKTLNLSISSLEMVTRMEPRPVQALADLSAAYIVRAAARQTPRDLFFAVDAAERSLRLDPRHAAALFNVALALERLALTTEAIDAWGRWRPRSGQQVWMGQ